MKRIKFALFSIPVVLTLLWWLADPLVLQGNLVFGLRSILVNYTGVLGIGVMSIGMLLALRPVILEPLLGGMDKLYRLHKWLGITGLSVAVTHWLWIKGPKWAVGWGWLERPPRGPRPQPAEEIFRFFQSQRGLAETVGEWAFYAFVVFAAIALIKRFPYRRFFQTHRLLAVVYLALVMHGVVLLPFAYWSTPLGVVLALLMTGGSYAAVRSLAGKIGAGRRVPGTVEALHAHPGNGVLEITIRLQGAWRGHRAGQFAFVTFDEQEGPHPFTIASAWQGNGRLVFLVKGLGDYTRHLPAALKPGDTVKVEGPYGCFDFQGTGSRQIWVAGGIGITPFMARMGALAREGGGEEVDLFYSTSMEDQSFIARLRELARAARVRLHVLVAPRDGRLDAEGICRTVADWRAADLWFCGPAGFGRSLAQAFAARGVPGERFHQELFEMR